PASGVGFGVSIGFGGAVRAFFNASTVASVSWGSLVAFSSQLSQHRKTDWLSTVVLNGFPIDPRSVFCRTGQYFWASASRRSVGSRFAGSMRALRSSAPTSSGVDGRTATPDDAPLPPLPPK